MLMIRTGRKISIKVWLLIPALLAAIVTVHKYTSTPDLFSVRAQLKCEIPSHELCRNLVLNFTGDLVDNGNAVGLGSSIIMVNYKKLIFESRAATEEQAIAQLGEHLEAINLKIVERVTTFLSLIDEYPLLHERSKDPKWRNFDFNRYAKFALGLMQIRENDNKALTMYRHSVRKVAPNTGFFVFSWSIFCLTLSVIPAFIRALAGTSFLDHGKNKKR